MATVGEILSCEREARNAHDRYVVAVKMTGTSDIVAWALADIAGQKFPHLRYFILLVDELDHIWYRKEKREKTGRKKRSKIEISTFSFLKLKKDSETFGVCIPLLFLVKLLL